MDKINPALVPQFTLRDGSKIPAIGMGTFGSDHADPAEVSAAVAGAIEAGYRLFDCAAVYGNEDEIGKVFAAAFKRGTVTREELTVTTKVWNDMHGKGDVLLSCAKSLRDLQLEYVDVFFVHWPFPNYHAPFCDVNSRNPDSRPFRTEEFMAVWRQCERLVDMGLVRHLGMSNMTIAKLNAVLPECRILPDVMEFELHPSFQQQEIFDYALAHNIVPIGFCPIGSPNRPERDKMPDDVDDMQMPELVEIANAHGVHPALICLKWAVQRGQIPIPFSTREKNYVANLRCVTEDPLTDAEMATIATLERNCRLVKGHVFLWEGAKDWRDLWDEDGRIVE